jgi:hypothetical protein
VRFVGEEGIFVGVQQDFLQTCLNQLAALNPPLFVPTEEKSDRFHINRHYTPSNNVTSGYMHPELLKNPGFTETLIFKKIFLQFVGGLLCRCMLVGLEIPFKLSFYTLGFLCNPTAKDDSQYTLYYLLDHPEKSAETLGLLKVKPEEFPYLIMNFNTPYPISQEDPTIDPRQQQSRQRSQPRQKKTTSVGSPKNPDLTIENTENFINRTAYYVLSTVDANDPSIIAEEARAEYKKIRRDNLKLLKAFRKGFYIRPEGIAANETVAVNVLDKLLNDGGISAEKFRAWLQSSPPTIQYPEIDTVNMTPEQVQYLRSIYPLQWRAGTIFVNDILGNPSVKLPYDKIEGFDTLIQGKSAEEIATIKKEFYFKSFIPNLLYFWTSSRMIHPDKAYKIAFNINDPAHDPHALARLPMSHTCFYTLDIPTFYAVDTKEGIRDALLEKLVVAIYKNVGFGVAGGARAKRR